MLRDRGSDRGRGDLGCEEAQAVEVQCGDLRRVAVAHRREDIHIQRIDRLVVERDIYRRWRSASTTNANAAEDCRRLG